MSLRTKAALAIRYGFIVATLIGFTWAIASNWQAVEATIVTTNPWLATASAATALAGVWISMFVWRAFVVEQTPLTLGQSHALFFIAQMGKYIPGSIWAVVAQVRLAKQYKLSTAKAFSAQLLFMWTLVITGLMVGLPAAIFINHLPWWLLTVELPLSLALWPAALSWVASILGRLKRSSSAGVQEETAAHERGSDEVAAINDASDVAKCNVASRNEVRASEVTVSEVETNEDASSLASPIVMGSKEQTAGEVAVRKGSVSDSNSAEGNQGPIATWPMILKASAAAFLMWILYGAHVLLLVAPLKPEPTAQLDLAGMGMVGSVYALAWTLGFLFIIAPAGLGIRETIMIVGLYPLLAAGLPGRDEALISAILAMVVVSRFFLTIADGLLALAGFIGQMRSKTKA